MKYIFSDAPIVSRREDRRTLRQKRIASDRRQRRLEKFAEHFSVGELAAMGFYESSDKPLPYGVEVWRRHCMISDENGWRDPQYVLTLALCLPRMESLQFVERIEPSYWEASQTFYWGFKQHSKTALYCALDLLNRLHRLPHWDLVDSIPVRWKAGNQNCLEFARTQIEKINSGTFSLRPPLILPAGLPLSELRHRHTPYDYEWQTGKRPRDEAKAHWNKAIREELAKMSEKA